MVRIACGCLAFTAGRRPTSSKARSPTERHGIRRRPTEGGRDRRLLAGAHRQARRANDCRGFVMRVQLVDIAHARSGDKGDTANVGVIALRPEFYPLLDKYVTRELVRAHFKGVITGDVERYELPNLRALNFLLHGALDGGSTLSHKPDAPGQV